MFDTQWGMPGQPWHQQGSFIDPATPPLDDVDAGSLVQLPCVNKDWVKLICGSLDQLRNPTTWGDLPDSSMSQVLDRVDKLLHMIGSSPGVLCVNPVVSLAFDCTDGLVATLADGSNVPVTGWNANFCTCSTACIIPPTPPNPGTTPHDQHACNIAGFLAVGVLQATIAIAQGFANIATEVGNFVAQVSTQLAAAYPEAVLIIDAAHFFWDEYVAGVRSHFTDASTDTVLWSDVTCAIFSAIRAAGYVTASNLAAVQANICAVSYTHADVITALCAFVDHLPLLAWQAMQAPGALDDVDCSSCPTAWCWETNLLTSSAGFSTYHGCAFYTSGVGWQSCYYATDNDTQILITASLGRTVSITSIHWQEIAHSSNIHGFNRWELWLGGTFVTEWSIDATPDGTLHTYAPPGTGPWTGDTVYFIYEASGNVPGAVLVNFQLIGDAGVNPFGGDNCTY